jgi:hypothetical protein
MPSAANVVPRVTNVIPSAARDLQFRVDCRSLASLGMTTYALEMTTYALGMTNN